MLTYVCIYPQFVTGEKTIKTRVPTCMTKYQHLVQNIPNELKMYIKRFQHVDCGLIAAGG